MSTAGLVVAAPADKGMVVIGQSLWWKWLKDGVDNNTDNTQLLLNLLTKPYAD